MATSRIKTPAQLRLYLCHVAEECAALRTGSDPDLTIEDVLEKAEEALELASQARWYLNRPELLEMRLCEIPHLFLKPEQPYIFTVDPNCKNCVAADHYSRLPD